MKQLSQISKTSKTSETDGQQCVALAISEWNFKSSTFGLDGKRGVHIVDRPGDVIFHRATVLEYWVSFLGGSDRCLFTSPNIVLIQGRQYTSTGGQTGLCMLTRPVYLCS